MGVTLTGTLTVPPERMSEVRAALPEHVRLTRAEPGCLSFAVTERDDAPGVFDVAERFADRAAFDAHQARATASAWADVTRGLPRNYTVTED
ncbi:putative quinol monooxygenase [Cribrihabitans sp. XS_ASV171]